MQPIQIIGIDELDPRGAETVSKLANEYLKKYQQELQNVASLVIHIKDYGKGGKKKKYAITVRIIAPTKILESSASDWDLARTLQKAFKDLERNMQHTLKTDSQRPKSYERKR